ncbi:tRNA (adenosine(37)-N6)-threonylcarbamoyltransferase complex dimerization subunit type 1 TsaB [Olivibacter ginsenosidimutans]|uniref:tRNA (Adenosine(37)-N6)-threonylcarbamoyltransferase complex dimerization subunit type 1 TsaB n=1 Tax=Olivibacter ginsenosidimutans TaxID=1176537 RepID=A0ABP9BR22_9SPHI
MNILHIETATPVCSVALSTNGNLVAYKDHHEANIHASKLTVFIQEVLDEANCAIEHLHAVAVSKGPGSYTGLRIGVSAAKGFCYALDIPLIAIPTLDALLEGFLMAHSTEYTADTLFCPMIDARRMEVYTTVYTYTKERLNPVAAHIIDALSFDDLSKKNPLVLFGEGADKFATLFEHHPIVQVFTGFLNSARYQVSIAYTRYQQQLFEDVAYFEPFYLKDFIPTTPKNSKR